MKSIYQSLLVFLLFSLNNKITAQYILYGKWEVFCPMETPLRHCDICQTENDKKMGNVVYGFEMEFSKDSLHIINLGVTSQKMKYKWDEKSRALDFNYQHKDYSFMLLGCGTPNNLILKDKSCLLLSLERKEKIPTR